MQDNHNTGDIQLTPEFLDQGGYVYFFRSADGLAVKVGFSRDVSRRFKAVNCSQGLILLGYFPGTRRTEQWLHVKFRVDRVEGEWFRYSKALRELVKTMGLIGSESGPLRYEYDRDTNIETQHADEELSSKLMEIARSEVRRYLHSLITIAVPEWYRQAAGERIKAGMTEAKRKGKILGRPRCSFDKERAEALRAAGRSFRQIGAEMNVPVATVYRSLKYPEPEAKQA